MIEGKLRAPFPWSGGKSRCADVIWRGLGPDIVNYVEPFAGSLATLLGRPGGAGKIETVNDLDGMLCNAWRAIQLKPDETAEWCDSPVSELDLHAKHAWLVERIEVITEQLRADPHFCDPQVAGYWLYGICCWIGTGWCGGIKHGEPRPNLNSGQGVHAGGLSPKMPNLSGFETGVRSNASQKKRPHLAVSPGRTTGGRGVLKQQIPKLSVQDGASAVGGVLAPTLLSKQSQQLPDLGVVGNGDGGTGKGVVANGLLRAAGLPSIGNDRGINGVSAPPCLEWFRALQNRLRRVRVVCGDWTRVLGPSVLGKGKNVGGRRPCGVMLDPPYDTNLRAKRIYNHDAPGLAAEVRKWAIEHGDDPDLRIVLCGYFEEHAEHMPKTWTVYRWKGARGYASEGNDNREQETIWFSPHCLPIEEQRNLFGASA